MNIEYSDIKANTINGRTDFGFISVHNNEQRFNYAIKNMDYLRKQMMLFPYVEYFKKFQQSHPEIYNAIKNSFELVNYNINLNDSSLENQILLNTISINPSKVNDLIKNAKRRVSSTGTRKSAKTSVFRDDIDIAEEIFFNLFFRSELKDTKEMRFNKENVLHYVKSKEPSHIKKIIDFIKNKPVSLKILNNTCLSLQKEMIIGQGKIEDKEFPVELFQKIQDEAVVLDNFLNKKRREISLNGIPTVLNGIMFELEKVPEFYAALGLFLMAPTKVNEQIMFIFTRNIDNSATKLEKNNALEFIKNYYLSLIVEKENVLNEYKSIRNAEEKLLSMENSEKKLTDKAKSIMEGFQNNIPHHPSLVSEYARNLALELREIELLSKINKNHTNNFTKNKKQKL